MSGQPEPNEKPYEVLDFSSGKGKAALNALKEKAIDAEMKQPTMELLRRASEDIQKRPIAEPALWVPFATTFYDMVQESGGKLTSLLEQDLVFLANSLDVEMNIFNGTWADQALQGISAFLVKKMKE